MLVCIMFIYITLTYTKIFCMANYVDVAITTPRVMYVYTCIYAHVHVHTHTHFHSSQMPDYGTKCLGHSWDRTPRRRHYTSITVSSAPLTFIRETDRVNYVVKWKRLIQHYIALGWSPQCKKFS